MRARGYGGFGEVVELDGYRRGAVPSLPLKASLSRRRGGDGVRMFLRA